MGQQERTADFGFQRDLYDRQHVEHIDQQQLFFLEQQLEQFSSRDVVMNWDDFERELISRNWRVRLWYWFYRPWFWWQSWKISREIRKGGRS